MNEKRLRTATLHEAELKALPKTGRMSERSRDDVEEDAVDDMAGQERLRRLRAARGMWKEREYLPDFEALRGELDRPLLGFRDGPSSQGRDERTGEQSGSEAGNDRAG